MSPPGPPQPSREAARRRTASISPWSRPSSRASAADVRATGTSRTLASYERWKTADFNPRCVQPAWDRARRRLLVFDAGNRIRVLDSAGESLLDLDVPRHPECRAGALSPSGSLPALAFGLASPDIEVWDVDSGQRVHRRPLPVRPRFGRLRCRLDRLRPDGAVPDRQWGLRRRPFSMALDTGKPEWAVPDPHRTDRWGTCYGWGFSHDGSRLAVGDSGTVRLRDAATGAETPTQLPFMGTGRTYRAVYSDAGDLLACGCDSGSVVVLRVGGDT